MLYVINIYNPELSKRIFEMQTAGVAKRCTVYTLTESARSWRMAAEQKSDSYTRHLSEKLRSARQNMASVSSALDSSSWLRQ